MVSVSAYHLLGVFLYGYFNYLIYSGIYDNNASATQEIFVWHDFFAVLGLFTVSLGLVSLLLQIKIHRLIFELNGGFSFALLRIFTIEKIKVCKSAHLQFDIIAYLTTKRANYKYNRRFCLHTIDGI